jgi:hypothetical protein
MTQIKISCLAEAECDDDENKKGVKMAIFSNDVQLILYHGSVSLARVCMEIFNINAVWNEC